MVGRIRKDGMRPRCGKIRALCQHSLSAELPASNLSFCPLTFPCRDACAHIRRHNAPHGSDMANLAQELRVEVVDKDLLYACFGKAVLTIQGDELAADTLELWQRHWRGRELDGLLDIGNGYLSTPFARVIFLVHHYLSEDIGGRLIELVEVVLLCRRFLLRVRRHLNTLGEREYAPARSRGSA